MARHFHGRGPETAELIKRLRELPRGRVLIVSGASGSGKSSLVKAGLWRALQDAPADQPDAIPESSRWLVSTMTPGFHGDAFVSLVDGVHAKAAEELQTPAREARRLRQEPAYLGEFIGRLLAQAHPRWWLILDQMEELFAPEASDYRDDFLAFLPRAAADKRMRIVATIRSDFMHYLNARPEWCVQLNQAGSRPYYLSAPGERALAEMIEQPATDVGLAVEPALVEHLAREGQGQAGVLTLLGPTLQDLHKLALRDAGLRLRHYREELGGMPGVLTRRGERGFAVLAARGIPKGQAEALLHGIAAHLVNIDPHSSEATRRRVNRNRWPADSAEQTLIEAFSSAEDQVRLLVCGGTEQNATVEVAHEALLREWPLLAEWIQSRREALVRRAEVERDVGRWDVAGRPDDQLPVSGVRKDIRQRLREAGLWEELRRDEVAAYYLAADEPEELYELIERAREQQRTDLLPLLQLLTAPIRGWESTRSLGRRLLAQAPDFAQRLRKALDEVLALLADERQSAWHRRRLAIGDWLAVLGDGREGAGLRDDGLPDIAWAEIPAGGGFRIARYPVTNAQYQAFTDAKDYGSEHWWREGPVGPEPGDPRWPASNRPRISVAWVEALAFCRWLTEAYREAGLIGAAETILLPTEAQWELAAKGEAGRDYPWGDEYRTAYANIDETADGSGEYSLRQTSAVGLYPHTRTAHGLWDCAGNVWEWCLNKYDDPEDTTTGGNEVRALRGGSWYGSSGSARLVPPLVRSAQP